MVATRGKLIAYAKNALIGLGIFGAAMLVCYLIHRPGNGSNSSSSAQLVFVLAVLLISRFTDGYIWGVTASVAAVFAVNYAFTYPYNTFNLTLSGYLLTFVTMLAISLIVSVMNTRIKTHEKMHIDAERERLRADLFRAVSHDLRTPLTSIVGSTGVILENDISPEKQRELINDVHTDAQWLLRMVENLLAVTRVSQNAQPLRLQTEVVEEVLADAVIKFGKHFNGIQVDMEQPDEILFADMEPILIGQVLTNLLENAAYHGEHTSRIIIRLSHANRFIKIEVADNGVGIPEARLPRIFSENDVSARRRGADSRRGMGIGLSVCMSIVRAHGGNMTACNNEYGGATFAFTLPEKEFEYGAEGTDIDNRG